MTQRFDTCSICQRRRLIKADFTVDALIIRDSFDRGQSRLTFKSPICGGCLRKESSAPQSIHLSARGFVKRLTRKQAEAAARKLTKQIREAGKEDARRELADYGDDE